MTHGHNFEDTILFPDDNEKYLSLLQKTNLDSVQKLYFEVVTYEFISQFVNRFKLPNVNNIYFNEIDNSQQVFNNYEPYVDILHKFPNVHILYLGRHDNLIWDLEGLNLIIEYNSNIRELTLGLNTYNIIKLKNAIYNDHLLQLSKLVINRYDTDLDEYDLSFIVEAARDGKLPSLTGLYISL